MLLATKDKVIVHRISLKHFSRACLAKGDHFLLFFIKSVVLTIIVLDYRFYFGLISSVSIGKMVQTWIEVSYIFCCLLIAQLLYFIKIKRLVVELNSEVVIIDKRFYNSLLLVIPLGKNFLELITRINCNSRGIFPWIITPRTLTIPEIETPDNYNPRQA